MTDQTVPPDETADLLQRAVDFLRELLPECEDGDLRGTKFAIRIHAVLAEAERLGIGAKVD